VTTEEESGEDEGTAHDSDDDKNLSSMFQRMRMGRIPAKASREVAKGRSKNCIAINSIEELNKILAGPHKHVVVLFTATESVTTGTDQRRIQGDRRRTHLDFFSLSVLCM